MQTLIRLD